MVTPASLLLIGVISGIGGAISYAAFNYAQEFTSKEGGLAMRTDSERKSVHERIFGKGSTSPSERLKRGQVVNDLLPMPPEEGPPLPRSLGIKWPGKK